MCNPDQEIGVGLIGFGIFFSFLGLILFFDRGLLALGNGSVSFFLGLFFIFVRWPILGITCQTYGFLFLFGGFLPAVKIFLFQIPVVGWLLQYTVPVSYALAISMFFLCSWHSFTP
ncbi:hypothetical protein Acr_08g0012520 [Actinidia rufa]|uniref:Got1/Sft2-like vescicle transport protein family n=1 Tax=Actinidia rufa TaxID=165716 RepID=A0A7J0F373_9ERIC|nr:hypothetical protein Acr_08g0012520 [Actinidia rufa]